MLSHAVILCLAGASLGLLVDSTTPYRRITGSIPAKVNEFPYQVFLWYKEYIWCGGSVISANYVLTAAHCLGEPTDKYYVRVGTILPDFGGTVHTVTERILHPLYSIELMDFDLGLLRVSTPFVFSASVKPVLLPEQNEDVVPGTLGVVTGWGNPEEPGLYKTEVPIISNKKCSISYPGQITKRMICEDFHAGDQNACETNSGGPLVANGKQIGIVSWGEGCEGNGFQRVYTRVAAVRRWITEISGV